VKPRKLLGSDRPSKPASLAGGAPAGARRSHLGLRCSPLLRARLIGTALACALGLVASVAVAQAGGDENRAAARRMAEEAADLYDAGDYEKARDLFRRAYSVYPAPTLALWEARALEKLGRLVEAEERYAVAQRYELQQDDPSLYYAAVAEARSEVDRLRKRIPTVTIVLRGVAPNDPAVEVRIDERRVNPALLGFPKPVDPGTRTITVLVRGQQRDSVVVTLKERDQKKVELTVVEQDAASAQPFEPVAEPAAPKPLAEVASVVDRGPVEQVEQERRPSTQRTLGTIGLGLGAVGLATGAVTGLVAIGKYNTLKENCDGGDCPPPYHDDLRTFRTLRTASTAGYVVGAVGLTAGIVLLLTAPGDSSDQASAAVGVQFGPTSATIVGAF
jgi:hypothetical protein